MSDIAKASWDVLESGESSFICKLVIIVIELSYFLVVIIITCLILIFNSFHKIRALFVC